MVGCKLELPPNPKLRRDPAVPPTHSARRNYDLRVYILAGAGTYLYTSTPYNPYLNLLPLCISVSLIVIVSIAVSKIRYTTLHYTMDENITASPRDPPGINS